MRFLKKISYKRGKKSIMRFQIVPNVPIFYLTYVSLSPLIYQHKAILKTYLWFNISQRFSSLLQTFMRLQMKKTQYLDSYVKRKFFVVFFYYFVIRLIRG